MPKVFFLTVAGQTIEVDSPVGASLLQAAKANGIDMAGTCGGSMICATCHVYIGAEFAALVPPPSLDEQDTLEFAFQVQKDSRLGCQIRLAHNLDGLKVRLAPSLMDG
jgi:ferredoxin, 2Fe-2S